MPRTLSGITADTDVQEFKFPFIVQSADDLVGAAIRRPRSEIFRIRIGFQRNRNMVLHGRLIAAPTFTIVTVR